MCATGALAATPLYIYLNGGHLLEAVWRVLVLLNFLEHISNFSPEKEESRDIVSKERRMLLPLHAD